MEPIYGIPPVVVGPSYSALPLAGEVNWAMETLGVNHLREKVAASPGVKLGVVDTGCDPRHPLLTNLAGAKDFTGSSRGSADVHGHGTHCTGTVASIDPRIGVAAGFPVYHGKGLGDSGSGGNGLIDAMEWCLEQGCVILSCSWGGGGQNQTWERKFREWAEHPSKPWMFFAGGNSGPNTGNTDWPGQSVNLLNVAALNRDLSPASFSSAGVKIDTSFAGVDIVSLAPGGGFRSMSGTSMATPGTAGLHGVFRAGLEAKGLYVPTTYELRELLFSRSTDTHTPGDDRRTGPGWATALLLAQLLTPDPPTLAG